MALLLALGVVLSFAWRGPAPARDATATNPSTADAARAAIGTDAAGASGTATAPTQPQTRAAPAAPTTRPPHVARGTPSPARDAYERARSLGALFNALHTQSDPETLFFAQRALRDCLPYIRAATQAGQPPALDRYRPAPPDDPMTSRRKAAYETLQGRCSGFDLGADPAFPVAVDVDQPVGAQPRSDLTGHQEPGMAATETVDGFNGTEEAVRAAAEDETEADEFEDTPVFDRADVIPKII